jgi:hypothetical protein
MHESTAPSRYGRAGVLHRSRARDGGRTERRYDAAGRPLLNRVAAKVASSGNGNLKGTRGEDDGGGSSERRGSMASLLPLSEAPKATAWDDRDHPASVHFPCASMPIVSRHRHRERACVVQQWMRLHGFCKCVRTVSRLKRPDARGAAHQSSERVRIPAGSLGIPSFAGETVPQLRLVAQLVARNRPRLALEEPKLAAPRR